jgi:hypothetical protein
MTTQDQHITPDEPIEQECPECGALCLVDDGSYVAIESIPTSAATQPAVAPIAEAGSQATTLPKSVIDALRFYAHGHHYSIDDDHQQFDTVSGEPQNWLFSERDDDCTMIEDGSIAKAALCGGLQGFEEPTEPIEGEVFSATPSQPAAPATAAHAGAIPDAVAIIQTLILDWVNSKPGAEAKAIWNRIEEKLVALAAAPTPVADSGAMQVCSLGVGCNEAGVCYAMAHGQPEKCGAPNSEDAESGIDPQFLVWFDRAWAAYEDKETASLIKSKVWALKSWREQAERIIEFKRILEGLPQDAIDGGWTARGMNRYAKNLEMRIAGLEEQIAAAPVSAPVSDSGASKTRITLDDGSTYDLNPAQLKELLQGLVEENRALRLAADPVSAPVVDSGALYTIDQMRDYALSFHEARTERRLSADANETLHSQNVGYSDGYVAGFKASEARAAAPVSVDEQQAGHRLTAAARDVLAERERQMTKKGWTLAHDDQYEEEEMAVAAACYAESAAGFHHPSAPPATWPWAYSWWKPTTPRRDLIKAGALILAEIERIDRAATTNTGADHD